MRCIGRTMGQGGFRAAVLVVLLAVSVTATGRPIALAADSAELFRVVVHPEHTAAVLERQFLADAFLKKATRWQDGAPIGAVDQRADAPARQHFSKHVVRRSVSAIKSYWQQRIFSGRGVPPPELSSDDAVLRYVRTHPGSVGYVSADAETSTVKVVTLR